jgi:hypothetical protein
LAPQPYFTDVLNDVLAKYGKQPVVKNPLLLGK